MWYNWRKKANNKISIWKTSNASSVINSTQCTLPIDLNPGLLLQLGASAETSSCSACIIVEAYNSPAPGQADLFSPSYFPGVLSSSCPSEHTWGPGKETCKGVLALQCCSWWIQCKDFLNKCLPQIAISLHSCTAWRQLLPPYPALLQFYDCHTAAAPTASSFPMQGYNIGQGDFYC